MVAGPSEILIVADKTADPAFLAADLMSQAEHDKMASAILLTTSIDLARAAAHEIEKQVKNLERQEIIRESLENYGEIIVCADLKQAIDFANELAPEHLELCVAGASRRLLCGSKPCFADFGYSKIFLTSRSRQLCKEVVIYLLHSCRASCGKR